MANSNFKHSYLQDKIGIDKLDEFITRWHSRDTADKSLQDFLGLTDAEFEALMHGHSELIKLLDSQKTNQ
jgi:hypothetical protein